MGELWLARWAESCPTAPQNLARSKANNQSFVRAAATTSLISWQRAVSGLIALRYCGHNMVEEPTFVRTAVRGDLQQSGGG